MRGARYLIRFDDVCPTMNWSVWEKVESLMFELDLRPIVAVVPDNLDPKLMVMPERHDFWERVRYWQSLGWTIALHGYQHRYETSSGGLIGINPYSEFAGLPHDIQRWKLESALKIFSQKGIVTSVWVAPAHSFDEITIQLLADFDFEVISDGYYWRVIRKNGVVWVPQQIWRFRAFPIGTWTICYHPNNFSATDLEQLSLDLRTFRHRIVSLPDILKTTPPFEGYFDRFFNWSWRKAINFRRGLRT